MIPITLLRQRFEAYELRYNPNHDAHGEFASASASANKLSVKAKEASAHARAVERARGGGNASKADHAAVAKAHHEAAIAHAKASDMHQYAHDTAHDMRVGDKHYGKMSDHNDRVNDHMTSHRGYGGSH